MKVFVAGVLGLLALSTGYVGSYADGGLAMGLVAESALFTASSVLMLWWRFGVKPRRVSR